MKHYNIVAVVVIKRTMRYIKLCSGILNCKEDYILIAAKKSNMSKEDILADAIDDLNNTDKSDVLQYAKKLLQKKKISVDILRFVEQIRD